MEKLKIDSVGTKDQALVLIAEIDNLVSDLSKKSAGKLTFSGDLEKVMEENKVDAKDEDELKKFLERLRVGLLKLPTVEITIAFKPSKSFVEKLSEWVKENVDGGTIVDTIWDDSLVGGLTVSYLGKYADLSLTKKLKEVWEKDREELLGMTRLRQDSGGQAK